MSKIKYSYLVILLVFFILVNTRSLKAQDSCKYRDFYYLNYEKWKDVKVISDSLNFNKYILFKVSLNKDSEDINIEIFFEENLKNLFSYKRQYNYILFNKYFYINAWGDERIDSITYLKIINLGYNNIDKKTLRSFDRLDVVDNNASIFKDLVPWAVSKKSKEVYYIFKTNFDGILIENDIKRTSKEKSYKKNLKVLIPFIRYLPLYEVPLPELTSANLIERKPLKICLEE